jgi:hypothetical protein
MLLIKYTLSCVYLKPWPWTTTATNKFPRITLQLVPTPSTFPRFLMTLTSHRGLSPILTPTSCRSGCRPCIATTTDLVFGYRPYPGWPQSSGTLCQGKHDMSPEYIHPRQPHLTYVTNVLLLWPMYTLTRSGTHGWAGKHDMFPAHIHPRQPHLTYVLPLPSVYIDKVRNTWLR